MMPTNHRYHFFLGGYDLEMVTIAELLRENDCDFSDQQLRLGPVASAYKEEIRRVQGQGVMPVLVELTNDLEPEISTKVAEVDHHGHRAGANVTTSHYVGT